MKFNNILKILLTISLAGLSCSPALATSDSKIDIAKMLKDLEEKAKEKMEKEAKEKKDKDKDKKDDDFANMLKAMEEKKKKEKEKQNKKSSSSLPNDKKIMNKNLNDAKTNNKNYRTFEIKFGPSSTDSYKDEVLLAIGELFKDKFKNLNSSLADELFKDAPDIFITNSKSQVGDSKIVEIPFFCKNFFSEDNDKNSPQNATKYKQCLDILRKLKEDLKNSAKNDKLADSEVVIKDGKKIKVSKSDIKSYINKIWGININVSPSDNKDVINDNIKGNSSSEKNVLSSRSSEKKSENSVIESKLKLLQERVESLEKKCEKLGKKCENLGEKIKKNKNTGKKNASLPFK